MKIENNKIIEATEHELFQHYLNEAYFLMIDYNDFKSQCIKNGTKIIDEKSETDKAHDVDKVEVVRCKDCKWWDSENGIMGYCHAARHSYMSGTWDISIYRKSKADFFCADGEREESEDENNENPT